MDGNLESLRISLARNRSIRRFDAQRLVPYEHLKRLIDLTRYCASAGNKQPLKYRIVTDTSEVNSVFPLLKWAAYLTDWDGPDPVERPTSYIVQCLDTDIAADCLCDDGLHLEAITLGATALGLGCCIIKSFNMQALIDTLGLPENLRPRYVVAIGYPRELIRLVDMASPTDSYQYYRDPQGVHYVPKRTLNDIII